MSYPFFVPSNHATVEWSKQEFKEDGDEEKERGVKHNLWSRSRNVHERWRGIRLSVRPSGGAQKRTELRHTVTENTCAHCPAQRPLLPR